MLKIKAEVLRKRLNKLDEYLAIDRKIVHDVLRNSLGDLEELRRSFAQFL